MQSSIFSKFVTRVGASDQSPWEHDAVLLDRDDVSDFNEENILPVSPEKKAEIRKWLQPTAYNDEGSEFKKHLSCHLVNTGNWLLDEPAYRKWHSSEDNGILWIKGIPGSGKSVVAATLVDHLTSEKVPVLYFFFRQIIDANHIPQAALRDWLDQILEYSPPLQAQLAQHLKESRTLESLSATDFWALIKLAMLYLPRAYCVVDALDEIDQGQDMLDFFEGLTKLGMWRPAQIKIVMTSRPVPSVENPLRHAQTLNLHLEEKMVDRDIATFVQHVLEASSIEERHHPLIKEAVPGNANGLFLYAKLAMDAFLEPGADPEKVLTELPTDLNVMYNDLLREHIRRTSISPDLQLLIMQSVTHASRPLRLLELSDMVNVTYFHDGVRDLKKAKELVRTACGPLLEILPDETLSVIHHSLTEFLKGPTRSPMEHSYPILESGPTHHRLALACLSYLQSGCFNEIPSPSKPASGTKGHNRVSNGFPFSRRDKTYHALPAFTKYAAKNWHVHVRKSVLAGFDQSQINAALDEFVASEDFDKYTQIEDIGCNQVTPLFLAVTLGLTQYCEVLLARPGTDPNKGDMYEPPLYHAAKNGFHDIVDLLVKHHVDLNEGNKDGYQALHVAAMHNHPRVASILLQAGADPFRLPNNTGNFYDYGLEPGGTPVSKACSHGHVETVAVLLPYLTSKKHVTNALFTAASMRRSTVISLLLTHPLADVNSRDRSRTLLYVACSNRDAQSIKILLEAGADPNIKVKGRYRQYNEPEDSGYTALHALARMECVLNGGNLSGHSSRHPLEETIEAFELILKAGANIHQIDPQGQNALFHACDGVAAKILLDAGASPYLINRNGENLLHKHYNLDILQHLLENANIDSFLKLPYWETTPLLQSLANSHVKKALLLLQFGADCTGRNRDGNGAFHLAVGISYRDQNKGSQGTLFAQLREAGAEVNMRNNAGCTPLHTMDFRNFNEELFGLLLEAGLDTEARNNHGETALFSGLRRASHYEIKDLCEKLVRAGCNIGAVDDKGRNLLHALDGPDPERIEYLVEQGLDPMHTDNEGNTLWHVAAASRHSVGLIQPFMDLGIDPNQANHSRRTPLHVFSSVRPQTLDESLKNTSPERIDETTSFDKFWEHISQFDPVDVNGVTPLHLASTFSQYLTSRLLAVGADPSRCTTEGLTVFHLAARSRQPNILGILLDFYRLHRSSEVLALQLNATDIRGRTAIVYACASGCFESVKLFIEAGATVVCDRYEASAWKGCVEFEEENKNWGYEYRADGYHYDWSAPCAGGVKIEDKSRPDVRDANHSNTGFKYRIDEIILLLSFYEAFTRTFLPIAIQDAVSGELDYTVDCLMGLRTKLNIAVPDKLAAEADSCLRRREQNSSMMRHFSLLQDRKFSLAADRLTQGILLDFTTRLPVLLHQLVHDGFVSLLEKVLTPEVAKTFDNMDWCSEQETSCQQLSRGSLQPLLITACQSDLPNMDMIRFLVEKMGVDMNAQTRADQLSQDPTTKHTLHESAIHYLVRGLNWWQTRQAIPYLVGKGANVNIRDRYGNTPLRASLDRMKTILYDKYPIEILVNAGADVNSFNEPYGRRGLSCLSQASDDTDMTRYFLQHGGVVTHFDVRSAISKGRSDILELFLSHGGPVSRDPKEATFGKESDYNNDGIKSKAEEKMRDEAKFPLHYLATTNNKQPFEDREKMANILLTHGADVNARYDHTTLMHCILKSSRIARSLLLHPDLNIEATDAEGCTLLLAASKEQDRTHYSETHKDPSSLSLVRLLLSRGANIRARDNHGKNLLHHMLSPQPHLPHVSYRSRTPPRDVDCSYITTLAPSLVNEQDASGNTPLHYAAKSYISLIPSLLDAGADPRIQNTADDTPLHHLIRGPWTSDASGAIVGPRRDLFERFIALGANIHARNHRGETPVFNFFLDGGAPYACVEPLTRDPGRTREYEDGRLEAPLYEMFEGMGVIWDDVDNEGQSLLHIVAGAREYHSKERSLRRFQFLMGRGLDVKGEDGEGRTPLDVAAAFGNGGILEIFQKEGMGEVVRPSSPSVGSVGSLFD